MIPFLEETQEFERLVNAAEDVVRVPYVVARAVCTMHELGHYNSGCWVAPRDALTLPVHLPTPGRATYSRPGQATNRRTCRQGAGHMKFVNARAGWITEGMLITIFAANKPVDAHCMATYYGLRPGDQHHDELQRPCKHTRVVLMKPNGAFVIVPTTPFVRQVPE